VIVNQDFVHTWASPHSASYGSASEGQRPSFTVDRHPYAHIEDRRTGAGWPAAVRPVGIVQFKARGIRHVSRARSPNRARTKH